ncbi:hypothetical protein LBMAG42_12610 [Deltaproteobacteria bacterium]|nr:hypothetical protein LBMAG42_12610 [Deltaproteobacteria bacterium]
MIILDRIEGERAVLLVGQERVEVPVAVLPEGCREGDVLKLVADPAARAALLDDAEARLARLRERASQGPESIDL